MAERVDNSNLGLGPSRRYAEDQKRLEDSYIRGIRPTPAQTEIDVSSPCFSGELDALFHTEPTHSVWATFGPPPLYHEQRKRLFTSQLLPFSGSEDKWEAHTQKALEQLQSPSNKNLDDQEKTILTKLLNTTVRLNKLLIEIYGKKSQYHKG